MFEKGDLVIYTSDMFETLTQGNTYEVLKVYAGGKIGIKNDVGMELKVGDWNFKKVTEQKQEFKIGDLVICQTDLFSSLTKGNNYEITGMKSPDKLTIINDVFSAIDVNIRHFKKLPEKITSEFDPDYERLRNVFRVALRQASRGKGAKRHGNGRPFEEQPIMVIADMVGEGFLLGQAIKKIRESQGMDNEAAIRERVGAINYLAASVIYLENKYVKPCKFEEA